MKLCCCPLSVYLAEAIEGQAAFPPACESGMRVFLLSTMDSHSAIGFIHIVHITATSNIKQALAVGLSSHPHNDKHSIYIRRMP